MMSARITAMRRSPGDRVTGTVFLLCLRPCDSALIAPGMNATHEPPRDKARWSERFRIRPTDVLPGTESSALERLWHCAAVAGGCGATLRQNQQPPSTDVWRATFPDRTSAAAFRLAGSDDLESFRV